MRKLRNRFALIGAVTLGAAMLGASPSGSVSAAQPRTVVVATDHVQISKSGDWIYFDYADELVGTRELTYTGTHADDACHFSGTETTGPSAVSVEVVEEREIARNLADCIMITERGANPDPDLRSQLLKDTQPPGVDTAVETADPVVTKSARAGIAAVSATTGAIHITFYEDPPGLTVNEAQARLQWRYNGSCVTDSWDHVGVFHWLSGSGWSKDSSSVTASRSCSYAETLTNSRFTNNIFCLTIDTHTRFTPNRIRGQQDGSYTMYWDADAWGGCNWLLSFHRYHFRY